MAFIIYGTKEATIGMDEFMIKCPSCEAHSFADVLIVSRYFHFYFIPIFPYEKEAHIVCQKCGLKRYGLPFDKRFFSNYDEIKHKFKHPWYTYVFMIFVGLLIATAIFF